MTDTIKKLNKFLTGIALSLFLSLVDKIVPPFETLLKKANINLMDRHLSINELKEAFFSLKISKGTKTDKIKFSVTKNCSRELNNVLKFMFDLQINIFPDFLQIAKVTPLFQKEKPNEISNYCPILRLS